MLHDLIENAGGCAVTDGGFATQLEKHGASINDPLWSAIYLIKDPHLIKQVYLFSFWLLIFCFPLSLFLIHHNPVFFSYQNMVLYIHRLY